MKSLLCNWTRWPVAVQGLLPQAWFWQEFLHTSCAQEPAVCLINFASLYEDMSCFLQVLILIKWRNFLLSRSQRLLSLPLNTGRVNLLMSDHPIQLNSFMYSFTSSWLTLFKRNLCCVTSILSLILFFFFTLVPFSVCLMLLFWSTFVCFKKCFE